MPASTLLLAVALTGPSTGAIATPPDPAPIVGGEPTPPGELPAVVAILRGSSICTGTLIAPDLVLTAAHCLLDTTPDALLVFAGDTIQQATVSTTVVDFGRHPDFCNAYERPECFDQDDLFDFAWIRLSDPFELPEADRPRIITDPDLHHDLVREGADLLLAGYGEDDQGRTSTKRQVEVPLRAFSPSGLELRAGGDGHDSCRGDSGGPALARLDDGGLALVGVLSRGGMDCGQGGVYGAPLAALCWVRDDSGAAVVPAGCEDCDCVDLTPRAEPEAGCNGCAAPRRGPGPRGLLALLALLVGRRRRAARPDGGVGLG